MRKKTAQRLKLTAVKNGIYTELRSFGAHGLTLTRQGRTQMSKNVVLKLYRLAILIFFILLIWAIIDDEAEREDRIEHPPVVDSVEMENDLKSNAMNAKEKYIVKWGLNVYKVTGIIDNVDPNGDCIFLKSSKNSEDSYMRCYIDKGNSELGSPDIIRQIKHMATLQSGDTITLKIEITNINENFQYESKIIEFLPTEYG